MCILWYRLSIVVTHTKKHLQFFDISGQLTFVYSFFFSGSTVTPDSVTMCPKYSNLYIPKQHFFILAFKEYRVLTNLKYYNLINYNLNCCYSQKYTKVIFTKLSPKCCQHNARYMLYL